MHETSARAWCTGKTQSNWVERAVGGGIGMGNTCKTSWLIHVNVWQNPLKCCEVISLQLIIKKKKGSRAISYLLKVLKFLPPTFRLWRRKQALYQPMTQASQVSKRIQAKLSQSLLGCERCSEAGRIWLKTALSLQLSEPLLRPGLAAVSAWVSSLHCPGEALPHSRLRDLPRSTSTASSCLFAAVFWWSRSVFWEMASLLTQRTICQIRPIRDLSQHRSLLAVWRT